MSAAERLSEKWIFGREAKLRGEIVLQELYFHCDWTKTWLSLRRTKSESLLVTFYTFKDVDSMFCWHFCTFRNSICDQLFDVNMTGHLQNEFVFFPCKIIKMKRWNSWAGFFPLALFLFDGNNRRTNIDAGGGCCVITVIIIIIIIVIIITIIITISFSNLLSCHRR